MKLFILILIITVVNSRPQGPTNPHDASAVQIEKQEIKEITVPQSKTLLEGDEEVRRMQNTREIMEKIVEVNKQHGLTPKGLKSNQDYVQIPTMQRSEGAKQQNFQFPQSPFSNPIFDYLNGQNQNDRSRNGMIDQPTTYSVVNANAEVSPEDKIPGQYIKRKVTHHQTFIMPNVNANGMMGNYYNQMGRFFPTVPQLQVVPPQLGMTEFSNQLVQQPQPQPQVEPATTPRTNASQPENVKQTLENQTVENVKNIVNKQIPPPYMGFNPYAYAPYPAMPNPYYGQFMESPQLSSNSYRVNGPDARIPNEFLYQQLPRPSRQQWQWPLAQFFPLVIKDPFQQIFNAFTSMVEYGQQSSDANCADVSKGTNTNKISRSGKSLDEPENLEEEKTDQPITMDIEDLEMTNDKKNPMKLTFNFRTNSDTERDEKDIKDPARIQPKLPHIAELFQNKHKKDSINTDEDIKLFSKDNTGSGIFVQKLKVRKGGVAIAGPGGIATAGSGGTAIVGPNGYAYTQPDSLAIAGSGTKVIAVNPGVNLSEVIAEINKNKTVANSRLGKIVAVGPVVYYNKG